MATKTKTVTPELGIFASALANAATSTAKKGKQNVTFEAPKQTAASIKRFYELKKTIDNATAELSEVSSEISKFGMEKFVEEYDKSGSRPDTFNISDGENKVMYIVSDKYISVTDDNKKELDYKVPELLETTTTFSLDPKIFDDHQKELIGAFQKAVDGLKCLTPMEKLGLFKAKVDTHIKKGTIDKLGTYKDKKAVLSLIKPTNYPKATT